MFYLVDKPQDLSLGHSISENSETAQKRQGRIQDTWEFLPQKPGHQGSSHCGSAVMSVIRIREDMGLIPGPGQWVKDLGLP